MLNQKRLKELLDYNQETGLFIWKIKRGPKRAGSIAGCNRCNHGYISMCVDGVRYVAHRLAWFYMTGEWPKHQVDHINHIRNDNRWQNLRLVTHQENQKNRGMNPRNTTGITGVFLDKRCGSWRVEITDKKKKYYLGYFKDKFEAICARMSANNKFNFHKNHGINTPEDL